MNIDELRIKKEQLGIYATMLTERFHRLNDEIKDIDREIDKIQEEIDDYEIRDIEQKSLTEQLQYYLTTYSGRRSKEHLKKCESFFSILSIQVSPSMNLVTFNATPDFIKLNCDIIKQYLPVICSYACKKEDPESEPYHIVRVKNNPNVDYIFYYPTKQRYTTDGTYIRLHDSLDGVLRTLGE